jgi:hypothetical protein
MVAAIRGRLPQAPLERALWAAMTPDELRQLRTRIDETLGPP